MSLSSAIRSAILANEEIDTAFDSRIRPVILSPDDARPAMTYRLANNQREHVHDQRLNCGEVILQLAVWHNDYDIRETIVELVITHLDTHQTTIGGYKLTILHQDATEDTDAPDLGDEFPIYATLIQFKVLYDKL